ncbi:MAG: hypothetical protein AAF962_17665 [Actinomycetota bacterium]
MALLSWAGILAGGPLLPAAVFMAYRRRSDALARRHALRALWLHVGLLAVWLPIVATQLILPSIIGDGAEPGWWLFAVAGGLALLAFAVSAVGAITALQADVSRPHPPRRDDGRKGAERGRPGP